MPGMSSERHAGQASVMPEPREEQPPGEPGPPRRPGLQPAAGGGDEPRAGEERGPDQVREEPSSLSHTHALSTCVTCVRAYEEELQLPVLRAELQRTAADLRDRHRATEALRDSQGLQLQTLRYDNDNNNACLPRSGGEVFGSCSVTPPPGAAEHAGVQCGAAPGQPAAAGDAGPPGGRGARRGDGAQEAPQHHPGAQGRQPPGLSWSWSPLHLALGQE